MTDCVQIVNFDGALLKRGFWLYIWEITPLNGERLHYVGRTGDSSSQNAQSPFNRMSQHLGSNKRGNVLRRRLKALGIDSEKCTFQLVAYGPILEEASSQDRHRTCRDHVAALEKALAEAILAAGYNVMNPVSCRTQLDDKAFALVRAAFEEHFTELKPNSAIEMLPTLEHQ